MKESESSKKSTSYWSLFWAGLVVFLIWLAAWIFLPTVITNSETRGQFGDMFGVVNALFSGLAFAGIIFTILLQKRELELQREEMADTREVLKAQKEELATQNATIKTQVFESSFFNLLKAHQESAQTIRQTSLNFLPRIHNHLNHVLTRISLNELIDSSRTRPLYDEEISILRKYLLDRDTRPETKELREAILIRRRNREDISEDIANHVAHFRSIDGWLESAYATLLQEDSGKPSKQKADLGVLVWGSLSLSQRLIVIQYAYNEFEEKASSVLKPYFQLLVSIMTFISRPGIVLDDSFYIRILRAQLSNQELALLFFHSVCRDGSEELRTFISKYDLLGSLKRDGSLVFSDWAALWQEKFPENQA